MKDTWYSSQSQSFNFLKNLASYADTIWSKSVPIILFNNTMSCWDCVVLLVDELMWVHSMGEIFIMTEKDQSTQKYISHYHFVNHRFHI